MEDEKGAVNQKIKKAYCPPKIVEGNPCLEYIKWLLIPKLKHFSGQRMVGIIRHLRATRSLLLSTRAGS
ncbi:hypothetical protein QN277_003994 [Acacia crassicarpa]|uniref:tyrosine--tRNA ligase n=1 Tax=Acacia crassicarpa TaxID=499986 RepID=A0AAE1MHY6_9FABA|nr:hypothetical protein QN277_003994 [Acacia crassicarpa]